MLLYESSFVRPAVARSRGVNAITCILRISNIHAKLLESQSCDKRIQRVTFRSKDHAPMSKTCPRDSRHKLHCNSDNRPLSHVAGPPKLYDGKNRALWIRFTETQRVIKQKHNHLYDRSVGTSLRRLKDVRVYERASIAWYSIACLSLSKTNNTQSCCQCPEGTPGIKARPPIGKCQASASNNTERCIAAGSRLCRVPIEL